MVKKWIKEQQLKSKSVEELKELARELKSSMFTNRFQLSTGKLENFAVIGETRRQHAAVLTLIRESELKQASQAAEVKS